MIHFSIPKLNLHRFLMIARKPDLVNSLKNTENLVNLDLYLLIKSRLNHVPVVFKPTTTSPLERFKL